MILKNQRQYNSLQNAAKWLLLMSIFQDKSAETSIKFVGKKPQV